MKAVIMAAGKGTRMLPLTEKTQKVLIPINGKPFIWYLIENLKQAGVTEFGIIIGHLGEQVREYVDTLGIDVIYIEQKEQLGTGHAIMQAEKFCNGESFIVCGGDNLWSPAEIKRIINCSNENCVLGIHSDTPEKYGVFKTDNDKLLEIVEKPKEFVGSLINTGLYKFSPGVFDKLKQTKKSEVGEYLLTDAITALAQENKVTVNRIIEYWLDLGCPEDILKVETALNNMSFPERS